MTVDSNKDNDALNGEIFPTFVRYLIPSILGLIAMTSSSLVDGIFIGNYVGITALAAVNLIIPIITLLFGVSMMMSIGGSVRAGKDAWHFGSGYRAGRDMSCIIHHKDFGEIGRNTASLKLVRSA